MKTLKKSIITYVTERKVIHEKESIADIENQIDMAINSIVFFCSELWQKNDGNKEIQKKIIAIRDNAILTRVKHNEFKFNTE